MGATALATTVLAGVLQLAAASLQTGPSVNTSLGPVVGVYNDGGGVSFLGIPYGDSVSGDFRWTAPRPAAAWAPSTLDATQMPTGCPDAYTYNTTTEDCLKLNIYAPNSSVGEFLVNQSVERGKPVIMVSVDYRLGALGFLASREWNVSGNFGIMDQQLALHWVQQHIADFGGDPSRVTVHGQSAGAMSAYIHLVSPASAGLFQKAHIRSNVGVHYRNYTEAQKHADTLAKSLLCLESKTRMRCLREKSFQQIIKSQLTFEYIVFFTEPGFGINFLQWLPVVDEGEILPRNPLLMLKDGSVNSDVEAVVMGTMMNESLAFAPWKALGSLKGVAAEAFLDLFLAVQFDKSREKDLKALFDGTSTTAVTEATTILTNFLFTCFCTEVADALSASNVSTYLYTFRHIPSDYADPDNREACRPEQWNAACHAGDNMFAFDSESICANASFTPFEKQLSQLYVDVDVNLTAAEPGAASEELGIFGKKFNTDSPQQVIFGSPDATVSSLYHIEETAPGILLV